MVLGKSFHLRYGRACVKVLYLAQYVRYRQYHHMLVYPVFTVLWKLSNIIYGALLKYSSDRTIQLYTRSGIWSITISKF